MLGVFLDTETNGLNFRIHRILEIAMKIVDLYTGQIIDSYDQIIFQPFETWKKSDAKSLEVNGFIWENISQGKKEQQVKEEILGVFRRNQIKRGESVFICQNPSFDRIFFSQIIDPDLQEKLLWPYHWLDLASMHWAVQTSKGNAFPWETGFTKDSIAKFHQIESEATPHRAMNGVDHLIACYKAVVGFPGAKKSIQ